MSIFDAVLEEEQPIEAKVYRETQDPPMPLGVAVPFDLQTAKRSFEPYGRKLAEVRAKADALQVKDDATASEATAIAGDVKRLSKSIETRRKELIEKPNQYVKAVNGMAKMFTAPAGEIETTLKRKLSSFQAQRELERRKQEEEIRKAQEELYRKQQEEAKKSHIEAPPPPAPIPIKAETVTRSETGASAHVRKVWKAEILDAVQVPREFCEPSMKLINEAVKGGVREIKGVRIFEDLQTILRT